MLDEPLSVIAKPEQTIPKYCNGMVFSKTDDEKIIMSFLFNSKNKDGKPSQSVLIESIFIDKNHAKQIIEKLSPLL